MKTVLAAPIAIAALVLATGVAHADDPTDVFKLDKYDANLKQHGVTVPYDDADVVLRGLIACNGIAQAGSRDKWIAGTSPMLSKSDETAIADAALDALCPQLKGR
jgi:hypothetical protein